ncbi:MAG: hypothetical protein ACRCX2_39150 [Paraclostridium sp.]
MKPHLIVEEMIKVFAKKGEHFEVVKERVLEDREKIKQIYNQVYTSFTSEKALKNYIKYNL